MSDVASILNELKSEASFDSQGHFTLDKRKAREKMRNYQLIDPHYYVLELIQAAVASGATAIEISLDADDFIISFDGTPYTKSELDNIYSSLFVSQKDITLERFRELAIGLNSAQALNPKFIKVISGDGATATQLLVKPPNFEQMVEPEEVIRGTRVHLKDRVSWRVASRFFKNIAAQLPTEGQVIKERCVYCPVPIKMNSEVLPRLQTMSNQDVLCSVRFDKNGVRGILGIPLAPFELSHLQFVKWGVLITTRHLRLSFIPVVGVIEADGLTKNASQSDIVENDVFKGVLETVKTSLDDLIIELVSQFPKFDVKTEFPMKLRSRDILLDVIESRFRVNAYNDTANTFIRKLGEVELFETTDKRFISLAKLVEQFNRIGSLPFSRKYFNDPHPQDLDVVFLSDEKQVNFFDKIFAYKIKNVEQDFYQVYVRQKNRTEWESAHVDKIILLSDTVARTSFQDNRINCEMGLVLREPDSISRVLFHVQNSPLAEKHLDVGGLFFDATLNNDILKPNYTYDDVIITDDFKATVVSLLERTPALYLALARHFETLEVPPETNRYNQAKTPQEKNYDIMRLHLVRYLSFVLGPAADQKTHDQGKTVTKTAVPRIIRLKYTLQGRGKQKGVENTDSFEIPDIGLVLTDDFKNLKLFKTVKSEIVSLKDLEKDFEKNLKIPFVTRVQGDQQLYGGHIVVAADKEEEVLQKYFGWYKVENYEKALADERSAMVNMQRPVVKPVVSDPVIEKITFDIDGAEGEIGLLISGSTTAKTTREALAISVNEQVRERIQAIIMKQNRFVTKRTIDIPIGSVKVVVNFDNISINPSWSDIKEDDMWDRLKQAIRSAITRLAGTLTEKIDSYEAGFIPAVKRFLLQYAAAVMGRIDYLYKAEGMEPLYESILNFPLLNDVNNRQVSLQEIYQDRKQYGKVAYVTKKVGEIKAGDRLVLLPTVFEVEVLKQVFGMENVENFENKLRSLAIADTVIKGKPEEKPVINETQVLCKMEFEDYRGITGEIGLVRSQFAPRENLSSLRILKSNRYIMTKYLYAGIQMEACLNFDQIKVNDSWNSIIEDNNFNTLKQFLEEQKEPLVRFLWDNYGALSEEDRIEAHTHFIAFLTSGFGKFMDIKKAPEGSLAQQLANRQLFTALGNTMMSFNEVIDYYNKNKKIDYVLLCSDQAPLREETRVLVLNQKLMKMLNRLFTHLYDYTTDLAQEQIARQNMQKSPLPDLVIHEPYLVKAIIKQGGISGELALPDHLPCRHAITFTKNRVPIVTKLLYSRSNVFGVINNDEFATDNLFTDITLFTADKRVLLNGIYKLYVDLVENLPVLTGTPQSEIARRLILDFYYEQKQYVTTEYRIMDESLEQSIVSLPLIPMHDGRFVTIDVMKNEAERTGYIAYIQQGETLQLESEDIVLRFDTYSFDFEFARRMVGLDRLKHMSIVRQLRESKKKPEPVAEVAQVIVTQQLEDEIAAEMMKPSTSAFSLKTAGLTPVAATTPKKQPIDAGEPETVVTQAVDEQTEQEFKPIKLKKPEPVEMPVDEEVEIEESAVVPQPVEMKKPVKILEPELFAPPPRDLPPEKRLLFAIKKEFRIIRERGDYKLSESILKTARTIVSETEPAVVFKENQLSLNVSDSFVKSVIDSLDTAPHRIYYLLSLIYSTINKQLLEITDEDEMRFQMVMLENLLLHPTLVK